MSLLSLSCNVEYSLLGEIESSFATVQAVFAASQEAAAIENAVNIGSGLLVSRDAFHGNGTVLIHGVN